MLWTTLSGRRTRNAPVSKYLIDWDPEREVSKPQAAVKRFLRPYWEFDQVFEEFLIPGSKLRCDLINVNKSVLVEVSPAQHHGFNAFFHGSPSGFRASLKRDLQKERWASLNGLTYVELNDEDLKNLTPELFAERGVIL